MTDLPSATQPDTPIPQPQTGVDVAKALFGDLARPFAIYAVAIATAKVIWVGGSAEVVVAAGGVLATLYGAKVVENAVQARASAKVAIAQAGQPASA